MEFQLGIAFTAHLVKHSTQFPILAYYTDYCHKKITTYLSENP